MKSIFVISLRTTYCAKSFKSIYQGIPEKEAFRICLAFRGVDLAWVYCRLYIYLFLRNFLPANPVANNIVRAEIHALSFKRLP